VSRLEVAIKLIKELIEKVDSLEKKVKKLSENA